MKRPSRRAGASCLLPENPIHFVAVDADRDPEKGASSMAARRMNLVRQRLAITRSAAGVPRTYRIIRPSSWGRRLAVLLRRLVP